MTTAPRAAGEEAPLLRAALHGFDPDTPARVGVAVSGGGDSMALLHLMHRAAPQAGWRLSAVTVDHGLRDGAAAEAEMVARACARLGVPHQTLRWRHGAITGNLMEQASRARYGLIGEWAAGQGIGHVVLGHTADDQAETLLMGLARAAGLDGLSGMRPRWQERGICYARPLLGITRRALRDWLVGQGIGWADDPTNDDAGFARVRARRALACLAPLGITAEGLAHSAAHLAEAQAALRQVLAEALPGLVEEQAGALRVDRDRLARLAPDLRRRLVLAALGWIGGASHPPRSASQQRLQAAIATGRDATLGGCRFRFRRNMLQITREPRAVMGPVATDQVWDGRWHLEGPHAPGLEVRALGAAGLAACKGWRDNGISRDALLVSPGIWREAQLIAAPLAGKPGDWSAKVGPCFQSFVISH